MVFPTLCLRLTELWPGNAHIARPSLAEAPGPGEGKAGLCMLPNAGFLPGDGYPEWNDSFFSFSCAEQVHF